MPLNANSTDVLNSYVNPRGLVEAYRRFGEHVASILRSKADETTSKKQA